MKKCAKCEKPIEPGKEWTNVASDREYCSKNCALVAYWTKDINEALNRLEKAT